jgi:pyruvate-formate lyase-activating enzyme
MRLHYANIDVVGACNLRCPSCPNGTPARRDRPTGIMPVELFGRILEKLAREMPAEGRPHWVKMYNWGEPLLHPQIGELVRMVRAAGFRCSISSNLNQGARLEELVLARPDHVRVSLSGSTPGTYEATHAGGRVERVRENLARLRELLDRHRIELPVDVMYISYRGNVAGDAEEMRRLCGALRFGFAASWALLLPVERYFEVFAGRETPADRALIEKLAVPPEVARRLVTPGAALPRSCGLLEEQLAVNHDGSLDLCCGVYTVARVAPDLLAQPLEDIQALREAHPFCRSCQDEQVDRIINYAELPLRDAWARRAVGPLPGAA